MKCCSTSWCQIFNAIHIIICDDSICNWDQAATPFLSYLLLLGGLSPLTFTLWPGPLSFVLSFFLVQVGAERFRAPEVLYNPDLIGEEYPGIHETLVNSIQKVDVDLRPVNANQMARRASYVVVVDDDALTRSLSLSLSLCVCVLLLVFILYLTCRFFTLILCSPVVPRCFLVSWPDHESKQKRSVWLLWALSNMSVLCCAGFGDRLLDEVKSLAPPSVKIKISAPPERIYSTWIGGSILASLATFKTMCISSHEWEEDGVAAVHRKTFAWRKKERKKDLLLAINFVLNYSFLIGFLIHDHQREPSWEWENREKKYGQSAPLGNFLRIFLH